MKLQRLGTKMTIVTGDLQKVRAYAKRETVKKIRGIIKDRKEQLYESI